MLCCVDRHCHRCILYFHGSCSPSNQPKGTRKLKLSKPTSPPDTATLHALPPSLPALEILILGEIETEERKGRRKGWIEAATSNKRGEGDEAGSSPQ